MRDPLIVAIDQGSSSTKCIIVDHHGKIVACGRQLIGETHPHLGYVEQDAKEIWNSVGAAVNKVINKLPSEYKADQILVAGWY